MKTLVFLALLGAFICTEAYPVHASCKLTWTFTVNCTFVNNALVNQIKTWSGGSCGSGEKCMYTLKSASASDIELTHTTPVHKYIDDVSFKFSGSGNACSVAGFSTSETWYAHLDYSTNYCNMRNLGDGAGLTSTTYGWKEQSSTSVCTQYDQQNCAKY